MDPQLLDILETVALAVVLPLAVAGWRWCRKTDQRVTDLENTLTKLLDGQTRMQEMLTGHDQHLDTLVTKVASELGTNGVGLRDRLVRLEQQVTDHLS